MISIKVDRSTCSGFGNCVLAAEDVFAVDDDGLVVLKLDSVGDERLGAIRRAAYDCPTDSIAYEEV